MQGLIGWMCICPSVMLCHVFERFGTLNFMRLLSVCGWSDGRLDRIRLMEVKQVGVVCNK